MAKVDWTKLKTEYLTTDITYQELSQKYSISFSSIEKKARAEKWREEKKKTCEKIENKVREKIVEKVAKKIADRNTRFLNISDLALDGIEEYFKDKKYMKHIIKYKNYIDGKIDNEELVAELLDIPDTKAFANMISSLEKLQKGQRLAEGLDKTQEDEEGNIDKLIDAINRSGK